MICCEWQKTTTPFIPFGRNASEAPPAPRRPGLDFDDSIKQVYILGLQPYKKYTMTIIFLSMSPSSFRATNLHIHITLRWKGKSSNSRTNFRKNERMATYGRHKLVIVWSVPIATARHVWRSTSASTASWEWTWSHWIKPGTRWRSHWWQEAISPPRPTQFTATVGPAITKNGMVWSHEHAVASVV